MYPYLEPRLISPQAAEAAFSEGVEILCKNVAVKAPEVASEMQLIRASAALGLYIVKSAPELKERVQRVMNSYLNRSVQTWVSEQGGWVSCFNLWKTTILKTTRREICLMRLDRIEYSSVHPIGKFKVIKME